MIRIPLRTPQDAQGAAVVVAVHLSNGGVIAYPTETVYGFGSLVTPDGLRSLHAVKPREEGKPVLLLASDPWALLGLQWNDAARLLSERFWPGPLTIALSADTAVYHPPVLSEGGTVAVRQTPLPALDALLRALNSPITSTSANAAGAAPATSADDVEAILKAGGAPDNVLILDGGAIPATEPSTVIDCAGAVPRLVRAGAISRELLMDTLISGGFTLDG